MIVEVEKKQKKKKRKPQTNAKGKKSGRVGKKWKEVVTFVSSLSTDVH